MRGPERLVEAELTPRQEGERSAPTIAPISILHVVAPAEFGGLETVLKLLASGSRRRGHAVHVAAVLASHRDGRRLCDELREADVGISRLVLPGRAYLAEQRAVAALCRHLRPDVLHTHGYRPDVVDGRVGQSLGVPTVTTAHGFTGGDWKNRAYEWLQRRAMRRFDGVVAVSRPMAQRLVASGVPADRLHLIPNAFAPSRRVLPRDDARRRLGIGSDVLLVGFVGRLTREKGADLLIEALAQLDDLPIHVAVIGEGDERPRVQEMARARGVASRVTWYGSIPDADRLFPAFDAFVLSSRAEGTPMALFEAAAASVPIVATRVGGVPDAIASTEGTLIPAEDPRALARAVRDVFADSEGARRRAAAARAGLEEKHGVEPWLDAYERVYAAVRRSDPERVA